MDDDLILNLAVEADSTSQKGSSNKKGGRWIDRAKAKRTVKRKDRPEESRSREHHEAPDRPAKKARNTVHFSQSSPSTNDEHVPAVSSAARPPGQIISSLFTSNPIIEQHGGASAPRPSSKPSNAPLGDSSTFSGLGLDPLIVAHLQTKMEISKPTSIQRAALPAILQDSDDGSTRRDVFVQSQTGSGKTLSFLLPIIQDLLPLSSLSYIDRSIGTLAIIIAPTRELAKQISDVVEALITLRLRPSDEGPDDANSGPRLTRWLVSGLLTGGSTRTHEKARLRKGVPILVSTPGRLLDHLQNTASFNVGKCRWLVLDEADRLMELGFEETITGIVKGLDGRRKLALHAVEEGKSMEVGGWDWERRRRTILCSATMREDVQKLAGTTLLNPIIVKPSLSDGPAKNDPPADSMADAAAGNMKFTPPSQLAQKHVVVPLKLRLVTLVALLRSLLAQTHGQKSTKIIVFLSCTDSVDFHWHLLGGTSMGDDADGGSSSGSDSEDNDVEEEEGSDPKPKEKSSTSKSDRVEVQSSLLPNTSIFRLHGSLPMQTRIASLRGFSATRSGSSGEPDSNTSSILLCTSVASRGLDLPLVRAVVQYDLPTEGGATEYVHRVGRTARVGKGGEAWSFVGPSETGWVKWVQDKMQGDSTDKPDKTVTLDPVSVDSVLKKGFGGTGREFEQRATEVQLSFERWVLRAKPNAEFARKAYQSHIRAYATHPSDEKHMFHVRHLHLGHLAKSFALREAPSRVTDAGAKAQGKPSTNKWAAARKTSEAKTKRPAARDHDDADGYEVGEAEKRMERAVRAQGRLTKKGGKMASSGVSEFQVAGGYALERLMNSG